MPFAAPASDASGAFEQFVSMAGWGQILYPPAGFPNPLPATIAASGAWNSGLIYSDGFRILTVAVQSTQAGSCVIQPYIDLAGTIPRPAITTSLTANTLAIIDLPPAPTSTSPGPYMAPWASFTVNITNTGGSLATLTAFQLILSAG